MNTVYVYGLCDPITQQLRYIGKSNNLKKRYQSHIRYRDKSHLTSWIKQLITIKKMPEMFLIEEVPIKEWQEAERFWISYFKYIGADLVNMLPGGLGGAVIGREISQETRQKISEALRGENHFNYGKPGPNLGKPMPEHVRKILAEANQGKPSWAKGKKFSDQYRQKLSEAHIGLPSNMTPETEAKRVEAVRMACKGKPLREEHKAKLRAAKLGKQLSGEHRRNISIALKKRNKKE